MASKAKRLYDAMLEAKYFRPRGWDRTGVIAIFVNANAFPKLPAYSDAELSPESVARNAPRGVRVPAEAFARGGKIVAPDESMKISLRAQYRDKIYPNLPAVAKGMGIAIPALPKPDEVEFHLHGTGDDRFVMVYRKG